MNQIKEEKSLIAYTIRVRKPGKAKPDSIYVFGNSPDEFVQNLRQQLRGRGYNDLNDVSAKLIKRNLQKQVQQFSDLSFANERIDVSEEILIEGKSMKNTDLKKLIKEEIKGVLNESLKSEWNELASQLSMPMAKMSKFVLDNEHAIGKKRKDLWKRAKSDLEDEIISIDREVRFAGRKK